MATEGEGYEIPVELSIGDIKKQLRSIKSELANATDPKDMAALADRAGELNDNLMRVNEQAAVFSSGSKFEQSANALGLMNSQLMSLDFEGAAESALLLQDRINSITPEEVTKQMQGLTQTFNTLGKVGGKAIVGMIKNVGQMAKAFLSFGAQLLLNPIFLFAIVIAAIVAAVALLLQKLGLLKPILDAIGAVFEWIGSVIDAVVQGIKDFLDWIGLTDYAAEDSARRQTEAAEKKADAYEKASKKITSSLDHEIRMNQINGKDTTKLELEKQRVIRKTAQLRLEALKAKYNENKLTKEMDEEELKTLNEKITAQRELIRTSGYEAKEIREREKVERKKEAAEQSKEEADEAKKNAKEAGERAKQYRADRMAAERQFRDLELEMMKEGLEKELSLSEEKYKRLIEDAKRNEKLTAAEKKRLTDNYTIQAEQSKLEIQRVFNEEQKQKQLEQTKVLAEIEASKDEKNFDRKRALLDAEFDLEMNAKELSETQKLAIEERYRKARLDISKLEEEAKAKVILDELQKTEKLAELAVLKNENDLNAKKQLLQAQMDLELSNSELTEVEKEIIQEKYRKQREDLDKESAEKRKQIEQQVAKATETGLESLAALNDLVYNIKSKRLKKGSKEEEEAARKNFEINKKLQIAQATIQGIQATLAAYSSAAAIPVVGTVLAPLAALGAAATALNNIRQIKAAKFEGGGGAGSAGSSPSISAGASSAPQTNLFGKPNEANNVKDGKSVEQKMEISVNASISESEVTGTQKKIIKYENSATLKNG